MGKMEELYTQARARARALGGKVTDNLATFDDPPAAVSFAYYCNRALDLGTVVSVEFVVRQENDGTNK